MAYDRETAARVRRILASRPGVVEKRMVGGLSFTVDGHLCCGITNSGLMVRLGRDGVARALEEPRVRPMTLGGKPLAAFVLIEPEGYADDPPLAHWVQRCLDVVSGLP